MMVYQFKNPVRMFGSERYDFSIGPDGRFPNVTIEETDRFVFFRRENEHAGTVDEFRVPWSNIGLTAITRPLKAPAVEPPKSGKPR